jgi:predicted flap endonuclease-1-like 5' DNA nuclease
MRTYEPALGQNQKRKLNARAVALAQPEDKKPAAQPADLPSSFRDDLLAIEGIEPTIEMALNSIGIRRFADFQGYTPETLARALQARAGISVTAETIAAQDWIGWAQILVDEPAAQTARPDEMKSADEAPRPDLQEQESENPVMKTEPAVPAAAADSEKVVTNEPVPEPQQFQRADSAVTQPQEDAAEEVAAAVGAAAAAAEEEEAAAAEEEEKETKSSPREMPVVLAEKIRKAMTRKTDRKSLEPILPESKRRPKASLPEPKPSSQMAEEKTQEPEQEIAVQIKYAKFMQQEMPATESKPAEKILHGEIGYTVKNVEAPAALSQPMTLCAQVHAIDLSTGNAVLLASKSHALRANRYDYLTNVDFNVPPVGRYQLQVVALLLGAQPAIDCHQGPILRVET